ncbi:MAG: hypothetical protein ACRDV3_08950 [Acidothermaceae bacterium]
MNTSARTRAYTSVATAFALAVTLAGCGAGDRPRTASTAAAVSAVPSVVLTMPPTPIGSPPDPAASNFSVRPAVSAPDVTLVDVEHGVGVVGVAPAGGGFQDSKPSTLWLSTDLTHWRDATPPPTRQPTEGGVYPTFDTASFLSPSTGWVTTWDVGDLAVVIYRTSDGGKTWSEVAGGGHGDHGGDAEWIQLVTPRLAFAENVEATAADMALQVSTDAGASWRTIYIGPPPAASGMPPSGPFELPMMFTSATRGFAATGVPAAEFGVAGGFFTTDDGGVHWTEEAPPPAGSARCPSGENTAVQCLFTLPTFADPTHAVLASETVTGTKVSIGFDTSSDAGVSWQAGASVDLQLPAVPANSYPQTGAQIATPTDRTWWIASATGAGVTTQVSTDAGQHWSVADSAEPLGASTGLQALDAGRALLTTDITTSNGTTRALYATSDAGHHWQRLFGR